MMKWKPLLRKIKSFRGVKFELGEIRLTAFDGYGFSILSFYYNYVNMVTMSDGGSIFSINLHKSREYGGVDWNLRIQIFFFGFLVYRWVIVPRKDSCKECYALCNTKEFYYNDTPFCCASHRTEGIEELRKQTIRDSMTIDSFVDQCYIDIYQNYKRIYQYLDDLDIKCTDKKVDEETIDDSPSCIVFHRNIAGELHYSHIEAFSKEYYKMTELKFKDLKRILS